MTILPRRSFTMALLGALLLGLTAGGIWLYELRQNERTRCFLGGKQISVMKTKADIEAGDVLTEELVTFDEVPSRFLPPNHIREDDASPYIGKVVHHDTTKNSMLTVSDFVPHDDRHALTFELTLEPGH